MSYDKYHTLRQRLFFLIRRDDVELAETFITLCPDTDSVAELNRFFRLVFSQIETDTRPKRALLDDSLNQVEWLQCFMVELFPLLREQRFPPNTQKKAVHFYDATQ
jgi:hypothetical protein